MSVGWIAHALNRTDRHEYAHNQGSRQAAGLKKQGGNAQSKAPDIQRAAIEGKRGAHAKPDDIEQRARGNNLLYNRSEVD